LPRSRLAVASQRRISSVRPQPLPADLRNRRLAAKRSRVPHRLKPAACLSRPAAKCRSFYLRASRSCGRAVMLITSSYPAMPRFHGLSTRKIHALIFIVTCFRVLPRPDRIAFRRHSWSFANRLASLEAAFRLATLRFSSAGLLPYAIHPGFPESFRSQFHRTSDPPDDRPQAASAGDCRAGSRRDSATPRTATSHSSLKLGQPAARTACRLTLYRFVIGTDEAVLLTFRCRRLTTVKRTANTRVKKTYKASADHLPEVVSSVDRRLRCRSCDAGGHC